MENVKIAMKAIQEEINETTLIITAYKARSEVLAGFIYKYLKEETRCLQWRTRALGG